MTDTKLTAMSLDRDAAHALAGALQDLIDPPPAALTIFEAQAEADGAGAIGSAGTGAWRVDAYFDRPVDAEALNREIGALTGRVLPALAVEAIPDVNWVALSQAALPPVAAGRFTVHGSHDRWRVPQGPNAILIDAGEAFGTAHHATTFGCLEAISEAVRRRAFRNVLDLGSGSGVLAIAAARSLPRARILATDIDAQSVVVARGNIQANGAAARIRALEADGLSHPAILARGRFDLLIANILAGPLVHLARGIGRRVRPGGTVILSGLLVPQAAEVIAAYRAAGFCLVRHRRIAGWATLTLKKSGGPRTARDKGDRGPRSNTP